jgi:hypothetical protein
MKTQHVLIGLMAAISAIATAQTGMTEAGPAGSHFSKLNTYTGPSLMNSERAIGIYHANTTPVSFLEINTDPGLYFLPLLGSIPGWGEMFSTNTRAATDSYWRMKRQGTEYGLLLNQGINNDFKMQASHAQGSLVFHAGGANEYARINPGGQVGIGLVAGTNANINNGAFEPGAALDVTGPLFFSQSSLNAPQRYSIIAGETFLPSVVGNRDGYKIDFDRNFLAPNNDFLVFSKTDGQQDSPDGGFAFTRIGTTANTQAPEVLSLLLNGEGRTYIGNNMASAANGVLNNATFATRLTLETVGGTNPDAYFGQPGGSSGLRFINMNSATLPINNPGPGVLSVDANGHVIYVNGAPTNPYFQCNAGNANANLPFNAETNLNNHNYIFHDNGIGSGNTAINNVGIGLAPANCAPQAKLEVLQSSGSTNGSTGLLVTNTDQAVAGSQNPVIGIKSLVNNNGFNCYKAAGWFEATNAPNCQGSLPQYAIVVPQNGGITSLGYNPVTANTQFKLDVNGDVNINGQAFCTASAWSSDRRFKKDIVALGDVTDKLARLSSYTYNYRKEEFTDFNFPGGRQIGVIAQELKEVFPELVTEGPGGYNYVNYTGLIPVLLQAAKEQQKQIDELKALVQTLAANTNSETGSRLVILSDKNIVVLNQNIPNPFAESTVISYNIPANVTSAQIVFTTAEGKIIKTVDVREKGQGQLNIFANDLSSGAYLYSLIIDGKPLYTKRMIKTE